MAVTRPPCKSGRRPGRGGREGFPDPDPRPTAPRRAPRRGRSAGRRCLAGAYRIALAARFCSACSSRSASPTTVSAPGATDVASLTPASAHARSWRAATRANSCATATGSRTKRAAPALESRQFHEVADQPLDACGFVTDDAEVTCSRRLVERQFGHGQRLEITAHRGHRCVQLVRDVGEQLSPHAIRGGQRLRARGEIVRHGVERARDGGDFIASPIGRPRRQLARAELTRRLFRVRAGAASRGRRSSPT